MTDLNGIRTIVFDFGNVILDIDFNKTVQQFKNLGFENIDRFLDDYRSLGFFADYQEGKISDELFLNKIREKSGIQMSDQMITHAWNAMLLNYSIPRLEMLKELRKKFRIILLSNTNAIHYANFAFRVPGEDCIDHYFDSSYYSHVIGLSKPSTAIYTYLIQREKIHPHETFFIDDLQENIDGAIQAGLRAKKVNYPDEWLKWMQ